ncbi:hypothetical protein [Dactylosporangium sp. CA-092794]|uniref:hypothetical protein n=1 Tax=Dactylosporangium sp. CA-092794 TaxID=3239929 RepID=UPI003D92CD55
MASEPALERLANRYRRASSLSPAQVTTPRGRQRLPERSLHVWIPAVAGGR